MSWDRESVLLAVTVLVVLAGFGVWYDRLVGRLERSKQVEGYRAVLVMGGVVATGVGFVVIARSVVLGRAGRLLKLAEIGVTLAGQGQALREMERIREGWVDGQKASRSGKECSV